MKITGVRIRRLRVTEELGELEPAWTPGSPMLFQRGGGSYVEVLTDDGIIGIGPEIDDRFISVLETVLIGKDPLEVEQLSAMLQYYLPSGTHYQYVAGVDIALWDILGKAKGLPLYKLWGGTEEKVTPYAAMIMLSEPEERAEMALKLKGEGWRAIKLRLHHDTMQRDIDTVEKVRAAVGDDMEIMIDANQAQSKGDWQPGVRWDYQRAYETALELQNFGCVWLEEPRPRYAYDELIRLNESVDIPIAGGENSSVVHDFVQMCERNVYSILNPECLVLTGITDTLKVGELARQYGKQVVPHNGYVRLGLIAHLHMVAAWPHAPYLELIHDPPVGDYRHFFSVMSNAPEVGTDGLMPVPQAPGLGVEIHQDLVIDQ